MTPEFYRAVDPIFLTMLDLLERVEAGLPTNEVDERLRLRRVLDQCEAHLGASEQWQLAKFALVCWIDEMLVETPWPGAEWWKNNVLEVEYFNSRLRNEMFYVKAQEASALTNRDALEVFYVCVVMGFRGLYREPDAAAMLAEPRGLPPDLESWSRQTALSIRLGQGLPSLDHAPGEGSGAPPLESTPFLVGTSLLAIFLMTFTAIALVFRPG